jgi:hypothetical protein
MPFNAVSWLQGVLDDMGWPCPVGQLSAAIGSAIPWRQGAAEARQLAEAVVKLY